MRMVRGLRLAETPFVVAGNMFRLRTAASTAARIMRRGQRLKDKPWMVLSTCFLMVRIDHLTSAGT